MVRGSSADQNPVAFFADVRERFDARDVDEQLRLRETQLHRGNQTMTAGEHLRSVRILREQRHSLFQTRRRLIIKRCRNHASLLFKFIRVHPWLITLQTSSGLIGISRCRTPNGASASTIAPTTAGVAPIVPASPTPLTPSGFTGDGVSVRSSSKFGTCFARGNA